MSDDKRTPPDHKADPAAARRRRQAEALRANLRRRKAAGEGANGGAGNAPKKADKPQGAGT